MGRGSVRAGRRGQRLCFEGLMKLGLAFEHAGKLRKSLGKGFQSGFLSRLFAEEEFAEDQVEGSVGRAGQGRMHL